MTINYIYNPTGQVEYAIIPISLWELVKPYLEQKVAVSPKTPAFNPLRYKGMLKHLDLDIEHELKMMRNEWL